MAEGFACDMVTWLGCRRCLLLANGRTSVPEHSGRRRQASRALVALCTAAVVTGGMAFSQAGYADPAPTLEEAREKVEELHHKAEQATERYHAVGEELEGIERRLERAKDAVAKQEQEVAEALADMSGFASASYQTGGIDPTVRTLLAEDPVGYLAEASVLDAYASQQAGQVEAVITERRELEQAKLLADEERSRITAIKEERETTKAKVEDLLADAEEVFDNLEEEERRRLEEERRQREREEAAEEASRGDDRDDSDEEPPDEPPASGDAAAVVDYALAQQGDPYLWAAEGPDAWDCSGLTLMAWQQAGVSLPRSSGSQIGVGTRVSHSQLQPGDLVFYYSPISHVGIYIGDGMIVHATHPGDVVSVDPVDSMPFAGASRPG